MKRTIVTEEHLLSFLKVEGPEKITQRVLDKALEEKPIIAMEYWCFQVKKITIVDRKVVFEGKDLFDSRHREFVFDFDDIKKSSKAVLLIFTVPLGLF